MKLAETEHSNFARADFYRKRGWIAAETGKSKIGTEFMKLISGDGFIDSDRKNRSRIKFKPYFQTIVDTNVMPRIDDRSLGWKERFVKVDLPFHFVDFTRSEQSAWKKEDQKLFDKMTTPEELSGILNIVITRAMVIGKTLTITKRPAAQMFNEYVVQSSSASEFIEMFLDYDPTIHTKQIPVTQFYEGYTRWCPPSGR